MRTRRRPSSAGCGPPPARASATATSRRRRAGVRRQTGSQARSTPCSGDPSSAATPVPSASPRRRRTPRRPGPPSRGRCRTPTGASQVSSRSTRRSTARCSGSRGRSSHSIPVRRGSGGPWTPSAAGSLIPPAASGGRPATRTQVVTSGLWRRSGSAWRAGCSGGAGVARGGRAGCVAPDVPRPTPEQRGATAGPHVVPRLVDPRDAARDAPRAAARRPAPRGPWECRRRPRG